MCTWVCVVSTHTRVLFFSGHFPGIMENDFFMFVQHTFDQQPPSQAHRFCFRWRFLISPVGLRRRGSLPSPASGPRLEVAEDLFKVSQANLIHLAGFVWLCSLLVSSSDNSLLVWRVNMALKSAVPNLWVATCLRVKWPFYRGHLRLPESTESYIATIINWQN